MGTDIFSIASTAYVVAVVCKYKHCLFKRHFPAKTMDMAPTSPEGSTPLPSLCVLLCVLLMVDFLHCFPDLFVTGAYSTILSQIQDAPLIAQVSCRGCQELLVCVCAFVLVRECDLL